VPSLLNSTAVYKCILGSDNFCMFDDSERLLSLASRSHNNDKISTSVECSAPGKYCFPRPSKSVKVCLQILFYYSTISHRATILFEPVITGQTLLSGSIIDDCALHRRVRIICLDTILAAYARASDTSPWTTGIIAMVRVDCEAISKSSRPDVCEDWFYPSIFLPQSLRSL
jgi:hypothetical protein